MVDYLKIEVKFYDLGQTSGDNIDSNIDVDNGYIILSG